MSGARVTRGRTQTFFCRFVLTGGSHFFFFRSTRVSSPRHGLAARQARPAARRRADRSRTRLRGSTAFLGLRHGLLAGRPQRAAGGARARGRCARSRSGRLPPDSSTASAPRPPLLSSHHTCVAPYGRTSEERGGGTPMAISRARSGPHYATATATAALPLSPNVFCRISSVLPVDGRARLAL